MTDQIIDPSLSCRSYLDKHRYLASQQSGFRSLNSVVTCLLKGTNEWYTDLMKAFDMIDHQILLNKMQLYGITGPARKWLSSYLDNRK